MSETLYDKNNQV